MKDEKVSKGWKTATIILGIVVFIMLVLCVYSYNLGVDIVKDENECAMNICENYDSYQYDMYEEICYCFSEGELAKTKYMR